MLPGLTAVAEVSALPCLLEMSPGTHTHLFWTDQHGPMSSGKGACAVLSMLSLAARLWAPLQLFAGSCSNG